MCKCMVSYLGLVQLDPALRIQRVLVHHQVDPLPRRRTRMLRVGGGAGVGVVVKGFRLALRGHCFLFQRRECEVAHHHNDKKCK